MEKINRFDEWPEEIAEMFLAFAIGLLDSGSMVSCLDKHIVNRIKYFYMEDIIKKHLSTLSPLWPTTDQEVLIACYFCNREPVEKDRDIETHGHIKSLGRKFCFWAGPTAPHIGVFHGNTIVPLLVYLTYARVFDGAPDSDLHMFSIDRDQAIFRLGTRTQTRVSDVYSRASVFSCKTIQRKDVPLRSLLYEDAPEDDAILCNCMMTVFPTLLKTISKDEIKTRFID